MTLNHILINNPIDLSFSPKTWITHLGEEVALPEIDSNLYSIGSRTGDQHDNLAVEIDEFKYMIQLGFNQNGFQIMLIPIRLDRWKHSEDIDSNFTTNGKKISPFALKFIEDIVIPKL